MSESTPPATSNEPIIARGGTYYRNTRYIMTAILCIMAGWFAYDGWWGWPASNERYRLLQEEIDKARAAKPDETPTALLEQQKEIKPRSNLDIMSQRLLAIGLPLLGIALTTWTLRNSRGEIRLAGDRLSAPGHPEITFDDITALDKTLWDRKDIAYVVYEKGADKGRIRLDAFVYQADPIVKIYERIEALMNEESEATETSQTPPSA